MIVMRTKDNVAASLALAIDVPDHVDPSLSTVASSAINREWTIVGCAERGDAGSSEAVCDKCPRFLASWCAGSTALHLVARQCLQIREQAGAIDAGILRCLRCREY